MKKVFFVFFLALSVLNGVKGESNCENCLVTSFPVNKVIAASPSDLLKQTLLIPQFDAVASDTKDAATLNEEIKAKNAEIVRIVKKNYGGKFKLVSIKQIESLKKQGYRYYLDVVIMPRQMHEANKEIMVSSYRKFKSLNAVLTNRNTQFNYYFYIRDLHSDDVYLSADFRGKFNEHDAMQTFLEQVTDESIK